MPSSDCLVLFLQSLEGSQRIGVKVASSPRALPFSIFKANDIAAASLRSCRGSAVNPPIFSADAWILSSLCRWDFAAPLCNVVVTQYRKTMEKYRTQQREPHSGNPHVLCLVYRPADLVWRPICHSQQHQMPSLPYNKTEVIFMVSQSIGRSGCFSK